MTDDIEEALKHEADHEYAPHHPMAVLAAEVRRLRAELEALTFSKDDRLLLANALRIAAGDYGATKVDELGIWREEYRALCKRLHPEEWTKYEHTAVSYGISGCWEDGCECDLFRKSRAAVSAKPGEPSQTVTPKEGQ